jgi:hypothetical protein
MKLFAVSFAVVAEKFFTRMTINNKAQGQCLCIFFYFKISQLQQKKLQKVSYKFTEKNKAFNFCSFFYFSPNLALSWQL